ncbi:hypothetical protein D3C78_1550440 [compost metagenome]
MSKTSAKRSLTNACSLPVAPELPLSTLILMYLRTPRLFTEGDSALPLSMLLKPMVLL